MRVAVNLLSENPAAPSGAHWFWTRMVPAMAQRLEAGEELRLLVSAGLRPYFEDCGPQVGFVMFPWSNERRVLRTLSEHLVAPMRLQAGGIDVLNTPMAPLVNPSWSLVMHLKTMHAFTSPESMSPLARLYRRANCPRTTRLAAAVIINSRSLQAEVEQYLDVDPDKLHLIYEAVDHDTFYPGDRAEARRFVATRRLTRPFVLFVSSLWRYKNCEGLLRAWAAARPGLGDRQLAVVGAARDRPYAAELEALATELGIAGDVVFVGGVPLDETARFYRAADAFVYPSLHETFGLPVLEAMASGCPVVTSNLSSMPEVAGDAAILVDPRDPRSIAAGILQACGPRAADLRERGRQRAQRFNWGSTAAATLDVYREVARRRAHARVRSR